MTDSNDQDRKAPLKLTQPGKLELKKTVEGGQVRQSFSHGRSKVVTVEVRKKRTFQTGAGGAMHEVKETPQPAAPAVEKVVQPPVVSAPQEEILSPAPVAVAEPVIESPVTRPAPPTDGEPSALKVVFMMAIATAMVGLCMLFGWVVYQRRRR